MKKAKLSRGLLLELEQRLELVMEKQQILAQHIIQVNTAKGIQADIMKELKSIKSTLANIKNTEFPPPPQFPDQPELPDWQSRRAIVEEMMKTEGIKPQIYSTQRGKSNLRDKNHIDESLGIGHHSPIPIPPQAPPLTSPFVSPDRLPRDEESKVDQPQFSEIQFRKVPVLSHPNAYYDPFDPDYMGDL